MVRYDFSGKVVLVTGSSRGMGAAILEAFARAGAVCLLNYYPDPAGENQRDAEALAQKLQAAGAAVHLLAADVGQYDAVEQMIRQAVATAGKIDILVNNAGIMRREDPTTKRDLANMDATIVTNLLGPIRLTDALVDHLKAQEGSAIVNVTSGLAFVPLPATATYSATKAAMHSYTLSLREQLKGAVELIELAPPAVQTDLTPGQSTREGYQPLDDFADEVIALFDQQPTPPEILVQNVLPLRHAERDGTVQAALDRFAAY